MEILCEHDLLMTVEKDTLNNNGTKKSCEGIKYDFILGNMALTIDSGCPRDLAQSSENAVIKSGEIAVESDSTQLTIVFFKKDKPNLGWTTFGTQLLL